MNATSPSDPFYRASPHEEGRILWIAFVAALALHIVAVLIQFPEFRQAQSQRQAQHYIVVHKYIPPPPPLKRRQVARQQLVRKVPIPDPTPDEPEPIREPAPVFVNDPIPLDVEVLIGVPEAPPAPSADSPLIAGVGSVTNPVLIPETKVPPEYPEVARLARIEGNVVLQAVIRRDGTVAEIELLRSSHPRLGFEDAATSAVKQWRYLPATQNGRPVDVYFTIFIEFILL